MLIPQALLSDLEEEKPPREKPSNESPKRNVRVDYPKKGTKILLPKAMEIIRANNLTGKEAYKFLEEYSPNGLAILTTNAEKWKGFRKDPNFTPPSTKKEVEDYLAYKKKYEDLKANSTTEELEKFLQKEKYASWSKNSPTNKARGAMIIEQAKKRGAKVEEQKDGTFLVYDDETTFKDTDKSFGKGRVIDHEALYDRVTYRKGNDLVNVYKFAEPPKYSSKVPTEDEIKLLQEGNYFERALDPEYKPYYASVYFNPENPNEPLTFDANTNAEDLERFKAAEELQKDIMPHYERTLKVKRVKKKIKDAFQTVTGKSNPMVLTFKEMQDIQQSMNR